MAELIGKDRLWQGLKPAFFQWFYRPDWSHALLQSGRGSTPDWVFPRPV